MRRREDDIVIVVYTFLLCCVCRKTERQSQLTTVVNILWNVNECATFCQMSRNTAASFKFK